MTRTYRILAITLFFAIVVVRTTTQTPLVNHIAAQPNSCTQLVEQALAAVGSNCSGMDRNSTCYGYDQVSASFVSDVPEDFFSHPADRALLADLKTIQTAPYDQVLGRWGVALMNVQANVPNTLPGQAVTFIMMGDSVVENAVSSENQFVPSEGVDVTVAPDQNARIRSGPNINTNTLGAVPAGATLKADAVSTDGFWVRVGFENRVGWVSTELLADKSILVNLPQVTEQSQTPMQAFYFTSGIGNVECTDAPDVVFVQSPKGVQVNLTVNGADIQIGSTVALKSNKGNYGAFSADSNLSQTYSTTLTGKNIPADATCEQTSMVMLEGQAILNDFVSLLPIGHAIDSISCRDGEGNNLLTTPWRGLRRLPQEELQQFSIIEKLPEGVLSDPVKLPNDQEIDTVAQEVFGENEVPTEEIKTTEEVTATPTEEGVNNNQPTSIPPETTQEA